MKAVVLTGIRNMQLTEMPDPVLKNENDVLLKIEQVGVCGSDVHYFETGRIGSQVVEYPFVLGHECAATVKQVGKAVTNLKPGDPVVVEPAMPCHTCAQCRAARENTCENLRFLGTPRQADGCLSEYIVMPAECCFPTNGQISPAQAVMCEPLAIAVYAVKNANIPNDADIAVLGAGPIGLSCMVAAKAENPNSCCMTEKIEQRIEVARKAGATWVGNPDRQDVVAEILERRPAGMDVVFECAGRQETIDQAVELLKPGGKLMLIGIPRSERVSFVIDRMRRKEITVINVRRQNRCTREAIDLVASGRARIDFMITHRFALEQTQEAFEMVAAYRDGVVKALIEF